MELSNARIIPAAPEAVWAALNDPAVLKDCLPGCETLERVSDTELRSTVAAKVGPVSARFSGKVQIVDPVPPQSYTLRFEGQGGAAGFARGEAQVALAPAAGGATTLSYTAKAQVGGKLAQVGSRLIDGVAAKMADDFFARFAERVAPPAPAETGGDESTAIVDAGEAPGGGGGRWIRWIALALIAGLIAWLAARGLR